jgi:hypothetical protein
MSGAKKIRDLVQKRFGSKKRLILSTAAMGVVILLLTKWEFCDIRWNPLASRSIPRPGRASSVNFWSASGEFIIEMRRPVAEREEGWSSSNDVFVSCNLNLRILDREKEIVNVHIDAFRHSGFIGFSKTDCFDGRAIAIPHLEPVLNFS